MTLCRLTSKKTCEREYGDCENCRVPNSFGFFATQKGAKMIWEQRFILDGQRRRTIDALNDEINALLAERHRVEMLPGKD